MIDVSDKVRELYKTDRLPIRKEPTTKTLYIEVKETGTVITEESMELENFTLEESICSASEIVFGQCEASFVSFAVYQTVEDLSSKTIRIWQNINGYDVPFGTYKVATVTKRDGDPRWKDITAYDRMPELDRDATAWFSDFWNKHQVSTIKEFRLDFFKFMGFDVVEQTLINDDMEIRKTIDPEFIKARYIAQKIGEINAAFGHFTRENKFKYIDIGALALYPAEDLYPEEDLYPAESTEILSGDSAMLYFADESHYEDYYVRAIDSVQIKAADGSAGVTVGETNKNPYIIHSNFFTFDKTDQDLKNIAQRFLGVVKRKFYIPNVTSMIGLPYLEVGDTVTIMLEQDSIESFIFQRKLTGIQALCDEITARGNEYRKNDLDEGTELMQLKSKVENVVADTDQKFEEAAEETEQKLKDQAEETEGKFNEVNNEFRDVHKILKETDDELKAEIIRAKGEEGKLSSTIIMTANEIKLAVSETYETKTESSSKYASLSSEIRLTAEDITSTVSATYETKTAASTQYANLSSQITQTANSITSTVAATYETKTAASSSYTSLSSQITQTESSIKSSISATYETKSDASTSYASLSSDITQTEKSIKSSVSATYETKSDAKSNYTSLSSQIEQTESQISLKVSANEVESIIEQNADSIRMKAGSIVVDSTYFKVSSSGYMECTGGKIGDFEIVNGHLASGTGGTEVWANMVKTGYLYPNDAASVLHVGLGSKQTDIVGNPVYIYGNVYMPGVWGNSTTSDPNLHITSTGYMNTKGGSSRRWKHDIHPIQSPEIDPHLLYGTRTREFIYNDDYISESDSRKGKKIPGFIIEELEEDYPIAVDYNEKGELSTWSPSMFTAPFLELHKEHHKDITEIKDVINKIIKRIGGI